jgi:hypothetical protein
MVPEDLLFWIAPISEAPIADANLLCRRHADAMVVPRGWTLDDRREAIPRLFNTWSLASTRAPAARPKRQRSQAADTARPEQMQIDGTGEISRPDLAQPESETPIDHTPEPWQPEFDEDDDLDGLLQVQSPLLARAFRGTDRPKH